MPVDMTLSDRVAILLPEPTLEFASGQRLEDPRDGLTLFGPLEVAHPYGIRLGVIGTPEGIAVFSAWLDRIQQPLFDAGSPRARPFFPGFEAAFRCPIGSEPLQALPISEVDLRASATLQDPHQRVHGTVSLISDRLIEATRTEDWRPDVWFVVMPDLVYKYCRPRSAIPFDQRTASPPSSRLSAKFARRLRLEPALFPEMNKSAEAYHYDVDFRNQLKARLLSHALITQVVRESTLTDPRAATQQVSRSRDVSGFQASIAWNLGTAAYYKAGGRPWRVGTARPEVCYVGLVFKRDSTNPDPRWACCAAQLFLDSGDGVVFRGALGPWYAPDSRQFHLSRLAAKDLIATALAAFASKHGAPPSELFIHGRTDFSDDEWRGFSEAVPPTTSTRLIGVRIQEERDFRLYRRGTRPVLRGTAVVRHEASAYLWTRGFAPRLGTYVGREVPVPLRVDITRGTADIQTVLADVLMLTKLNYNTCLLADGLPVTVRFADKIGEILTAGPIPTGSPPLPFRHYI